MKYASFKTTDETGINRFLRRNAAFLGKDGISFRKGGIFSPDRVCIFYDPASYEEKSVRLGIAAMHEFIDNQRSQLLGAATDERYWMREKALGTPKADENIHEAADRGSRIKAQIDIALALVKELETTGKFPATSIPSNEVMSIEQDELDSETGDDE